MEYRKAAQYTWFGAASLAEWKEYLDAGATRAEVHKHGNETFISFFKDTEHLGTVDESHACPIDCP